MPITKLKLKQTDGKVDMKADVNAPNATAVIGLRGICSQGKIGLITGIAKMPWGLAYVGVTADGTAWSSREPEIVQEPA